VECPQQRACPRGVGSASEPSVPLPSRAGVLLGHAASSLVPQSPVPVLLGWIAPPHQVVDAKEPETNSWMSPAPSQASHSTKTGWLVSDKTKPSQPSHPGPPPGCPRGVHRPAGPHPLYRRSVVPPNARCWVYRSTYHVKHPGCFPTSRQHSYTPFPNCVVPSNMHPSTWLSTASPGPPLIPCNISTQPPSLSFCSFCLRTD
jgi:hypothetical protein